MIPLLTLKKRDNSFIATHLLVETYEKETALRLINSPFLLNSWSDCDNWCLEQAKKFYTTEKELLQKYVNKHKEDAKGTPVMYKLARHGYGRPFPSRAQGFSSFRRQVRHTIAGKYYDIDIKNCQPSVLYWSLKNNSLPVPQSLEEFVNKRDQILLETTAYLGCERWQTKQLYISLFFMGSYKGFRERMKKAVPEDCPPFVKQLSDDLHSIAVQVKARNPDLYRVAYQKRKEKKEDTSVNSTMRTFLSLWCQTYEYSIVDTLLEHIHTETGLTKKNNDDYIYASYEFDGIKLLKETVDAYPGGISQVLQLCSDFVLKTHGLPLRFEEKEMDEGFDLSNVELSVEQDKPSSSDEELLRTMALCLTSHRLAAEIVQEQTDGDYIYIRSKNEWYTWDGESWEQSPHHFVSQYHKHVKEYFESNLSATAKSTNSYKDLLFKLEGKIGSASYCAGVEKMAKILFSTLTQDFDTNTDLLNFNNGILDIKEKVFRERRKDDYVRMSTGYDFFPYRIEKNATQEDLQYEEDLMKVLTQIHPEKSVFDFWLLCLSSGLSGRNLEVFIIHNGRGRNGKSLVSDAMKINLGEYFGTIPTTVLTENPRNKGSGDANSAIASMDKLRYTVCQEPPKHLPIQNSAMKALTGGSVIKARRLYKEVSDVHMHCTLNCEANARPALAEAAMDADYERIIDFLYGSRFTSDERKINHVKHVYKKDPGLKDMNWWKLRRNSFMNILVDKLFFLHDNNYDIRKFIPKVVAERSEQYCSESFLAHTLFQECYEHIDIMDDEDIAIGKAKANWDTDPTLARIVDDIHSSDSYYALPTYVKQRKENSKEGMKEFFRTNQLYEEHFYTKQRYQYLRGFRRKIRDYDRSDDDSTAYDIETLSSLNI